MPAKYVRRKTSALLSSKKRQVSARWMAAVLIGGVVGLAWAIWRPTYYEWVVARDGFCDVVIYCDTSDIRDKPLAVLAQYDQAALSPLAKALGLYQNRRIPFAVVLYSYKIEYFTMTTTTVKLKNVPCGPLVRILIAADDRDFYAWVRDRTVVNRTIHVRLD